MERQSAPSKKPVSSVVPSAMAPNMTPRWDMDLSPGMDLTFDMICFFDFHFLTSDSLGFVNRVMLAENKFCCIHGSLIV